MLQSSLQKSRDYVSRYCRQLIWTTSCKSVTEIWKFIIWFSSKIINHYVPSLANHWSQTGPEDEGGKFSFWNKTPLCIPLQTLKWRGNFGFQNNNLVVSLTDQKWQGEFWLPKKTTPVDPLVGPPTQWLLLGTVVQAMGFVGPARPYELAKITYFLTDIKQGFKPILLYQVKLASNCKSKINKIRAPVLSCIKARASCFTFGSPWVNAFCHNLRRFYALAEQKACRDYVTSGGTIYWLSAAIYTGGINLRHWRRLVYLPGGGPTF
jgi:hypothetical protein